jgi:hypothetical protein
MEKSMNRLTIKASLYINAMKASMNELHSMKETLG